MENLKIPFSSIATILILIIAHVKLVLLRQVMSIVAFDGRRLRTFEY